MTTKNLTIYEIPVQWTCFSDMVVEAESLEKAIEKCREQEPLPVGVYLDDSFQIFEEEITILQPEDKSITQGLQTYYIVDSKIKSYINDMQNNMYEIRKLIRDNPGLNIKLSDYMDHIDDIIYKQ